MSDWNAKPAALARSSYKRLPEAQATASRLRRVNRIRSQLLRDRGNDPTEAQTLIARNAATLAVWLEDQSAIVAAGGQIDIDQFGRAANTLRRHLETLGIERAPRDVTELSDYLASRQAKPTIDGETQSESDRSD
jgi:hypothetical protein